MQNNPSLKDKLTKVILDDQKKNISFVASLFGMQKKIPYLCELLNLMDEDDSIIAVFCNIILGRNRIEKPSPLLRIQLLQVICEHLKISEESVENVTLDLMQKKPNLTENDALFEAGVELVRHLAGIEELPEPNLRKTSSHP